MGITSGAPETGSGTTFEEIPNTSFTVSSVTTSDGAPCARMLPERIAMSSSE